MSISRFVLHRPNAAPPAVSVTPQSPQNPNRGPSGSRDPPRIATPALGGPLINDQINHIIGRLQGTNLNDGGGLSPNRGAARQLRPIPPAVGPARHHPTPTGHLIPTALEVDTYTMEEGVRTLRGGMYSPPPPLGDEFGWSEGYGYYDGKYGGHSAQGYGGGMGMGHSAHGGVRAWAATRHTTPPPTYAYTHKSESTSDSASDSLSYISPATNPSTPTAACRSCAAPRHSTIIPLALESTTQHYDLQRRIPSSPFPHSTILWTYWNESNQPAPRHSRLLAPSLLTTPRLSSPWLSTNCIT